MERARDIGRDEGGALQGNIKLAWAGVKPANLRSIAHVAIWPAGPQFWYTGHLYRGGRGPVVMIRRSGREARTTLAGHSQPWTSPPDEQFIVSCKSNTYLVLAPFRK